MKVLLSSAPFHQINLMRSKYLNTIGHTETSLASSIKRWRHQILASLCHFHISDAIKSRRLPLSYSWTCAEEQKTDRNTTLFRKMCYTCRSYKVIYMRVPPPVTMPMMLSFELMNACDGSRQSCASWKTDTGNIWSKCYNKSLQLWFSDECISLHSKEQLISSLRP